MLNIQDKFDSTYFIKYDLVLEDLYSLYRPSGKEELDRLFNGVHAGVYVMYSDLEEIIYVGTSFHIYNRLKQHMCGINSRLYDKVKYIGIIKRESFPLFRATHVNCVDVEYYLIELIKPKFNLSRNIGAALYGFETADYYNEGKCIDLSTVNFRNLAYEEEQMEMGAVKEITCIEHGEKRKTQRNKKIIDERVRNGESLYDIFESDECKECDQQYRELVARYSRFVHMCKELMQDIESGDIDDEFLNFLIKRAEAQGRASHVKFRNILRAEFEKTVESKVKRVDFKNERFK